MTSILTVTTQATDLSLLTIAELRSAVGVTDSSKDSDLTILGNQVSARIADLCQVKTDGVTPGTLRQESLTETFRNGSGKKALVLARRPIVSVSLVVEDDIELVSTDYDIDSRPGILRRLYNDRCVYWRAANKIVVNYVAGWATVPEGLRLAAQSLAREYWTRQSSNYSSDLRSINVPGVIAKTFSGATTTTESNDTPAFVLDMLSSYKNWVVE